MLYKAHKNGHHSRCTRPTKMDTIHVVQGPKKRTSFMLYMYTKPRKKRTLYMLYEAQKNGHNSSCTKPTKADIIQVVQRPQKQTSFKLYKGHKTDTMHAALGPHAHQNKKGAPVLTTVPRPHRNRMRSPS